MQFRRSLQRYGRTPEPETPFARAGQLWDERIGSARVQARNWRLMAFGCLGLSGAMSIGLIWQSTQSRVTPYVVEVDRLSEARSVSPAEAGYQPTDPQIAWHLAHFITDIRERARGRRPSRRHPTKGVDDNMASSAAAYVAIGDEHVWKQ